MNIRTQNQTFAIVNFEGLYLMYRGFNTDGTQNYILCHKLESAITFPSFLEATRFRNALENPFQWAVSTITKKEA